MHMGGYGSGRRRGRDKERLTVYLDPLVIDYIRQVSAHTRRSLSESTEALLLGYIKQFEAGEKP